MVRRMLTFDRPEASWVRYALSFLLFVPMSGLSDKVAGVAIADESPAPYPFSNVLIGVQWDWTTFDKRAPGSDIWPITWADDGNQYTAWGDGGGFGGDNRRGRVPLGVAQFPVIGIPPDSKTFGVVTIPKARRHSVVRVLDSSRLMGFCTCGGLATRAICR